MLQLLKCPGYTIVVTLGPLGFISYTEDIVDVIERHSVLPHIYADDTQLLASGKPEDSSTLRDSNNN